MRLMFTPIFLLFSVIIFAQPRDTAEVVVTGNCFGNAKKQAKLVDLSNGLTGKVKGLNITSASKGSSNPGFSLRCARTVSIGTEPLLVLDGVLLELSSLSEINPADIERIDILKNAVATAIYGCRAANGVIIVTTKKYKIRKFQVIDFLDGKPMSGATLRFINTATRDSLQFIASEDGMIETNKLVAGTEYRAEISAIGYKDFKLSFRNTYSEKASIYRMERDSKICGEVILASTEPKRWICYRGNSSRISNNDSIKAGEPILNNQITIYPNPVIKGGILQIRTAANAPVISSIRLVCPDGRIVYQQVFTANTGKKTAFVLPTDPRWPSGIYFIQFICENGRLQASEKIIIH